MIERVGIEGMAEIRQYLEASAIENVILLGDMDRLGDANNLSSDALTVAGYRHANALVAAVGCYRHGRCFPHIAHDLEPKAYSQVLDAIVADLLQRRQKQNRLVWLIGLASNVDAIVSRLIDAGLRTGFDERSHLCQVDGRSLCPVDVDGVRRAEMRDVVSVARLRRAFETEYFGVPKRQVGEAWCVRLAKRYIAQGTYVAEQEGHLVSMAAVEAQTRDLYQVGAVYTQRAYRARGLARAVVSRLCQDLLRPDPAGAIRRAMLTVSVENQPALKAYASIGFQRWDDFRMCRLRQT